MGTITPVGEDAASTWAALKEGRLGLANVRPWLEEQLPGFTRLRSHVAGRIDYKLLEDTRFGFAERLPRRQYEREVSRAAELALKACAEALTDAGLIGDELSLAPEDRSSVGFVIGSGIGGALDLGDRQIRLNEDHRPHSTDLYRVQPDNGTVFARRFFGAEGQTLSLTQACASGGMAIALGAMLVESGSAEIVVAGGTEGLGAMMVALFESTGAANSTDDPAVASRPMDVDAGGAVLAEGAGVIVLESEEHAARRDARLRGVVAGYGITGGQGTPSLQDEDAVVRVMAKALAKAGYGPGQRVGISPHATGTKAGDRTEANAIVRLAAGEMGPPVDISRVFPVKGNMGHSIGASGGIEAVASMLALEENVTPPAATTPTPLPEVAAFVPHAVEPLDADLVLSNSMGFGDQSVSVVFARP